jgi:hypothetical protein
MSPPRDPPKRVLGVNLPPRASDSDIRELEIEQTIERLLPKLAELTKVEQQPRRSIAVHYAGIAAIVAALGGAGGITLLRPQPPNPTPQIADLREDVKRLGADVREVRDYLRQAREKDTQRWAIVESALCKLNGKAFARGVDCDQLEFDAQPLGKPLAGPGWVARAEWPHTPRPP